MTITPDPDTNGHQPDRMMDTTELAAFLGGKYTAGTITRRWRTWRLPTHKIGRELRFLESDVREWLKDHKAN